MIKSAERWNRESVVDLVDSVGCREGGKVGGLISAEDV
jgi:hypothetical protein